VDLFSRTHESAELKYSPVLNAAKLPFIWDAPTKTDKEGAMKLAHLVEERRAHG
jgi:hypothetical protein